MGLRAVPTSVASLANALGASFRGDGEAVIQGAASLEAAEAGELSYVDSPKHFAKALKSRCSVIIAAADYQDTGKSIIVFDKPRLAFARALGML